MVLCIFGMAVIKIQRKGKKEVKTFFFSSFFYSQISTVFDRDTLLYIIICFIYGRQRSFQTIQLKITSITYTTMDNNIIIDYEEDCFFLTRETVSLFNT